MWNNMFYLSINTFIIFAVIVIIICLLYILYIYTFFPILRKNKIKKSIKELALSNNKSIEISKSNNKKVDFVIKTTKKIYNVKVVFIPDDCDLQINNIDTWYSYNQSSYKQVVVSSSFMKDDSIENRIVILGRKAKHIKKVINESEMIMVDDNTDVYGVHIINFKHYEFFLDN